MANRITITICGEDYNLVADETATYMEKVGSYVGEKMDDVLQNAHVGRADAAVLTAVNVTDELFKAQETAENLRRQLKAYLDESAKAKAELSEVKRELFKAQNRH
jgi:cell division protein ZapA